MDEYETLIKKKLEFAEREFNKAVNTGMRDNLVSYWQGAITTLHDLLSDDPIFCKIHSVKMKMNNDNIYHCTQCLSDSRIMRMR